MPRARFFETERYPYQLATPSDADYDLTDKAPLFMGELRGFYPDYHSGLPKAFFQPYNSLYHPKAHDPNDPKDVHRQHWGVDIYAPYFPFPYEIPIYALASGSIGNVYTRDRDLNGSKYQALGNRVQLVFKVPFGTEKISCRIDYGHLSRFAPGLQPSTNKAGKARVRLPIEAGALIGYAGKSGNADSKDECSTLEPSFRVNSGHVHLSLRIGGALHNIYSVLPRSLALHPDQQALGFTPPATEKSRRYMKSQWPETAATLKAALPGVAFPDGQLVTGWHAPLPRQQILRKTGKGARVLRQSRAILPDPFRALEFDRSRSLRDSLDACTALASPRGTKAAHAVFESWLAKGETDKTKWDETADAFANRAMSRATDIGPGNVGENAARVISSLMHLHEAVWVLLGGPYFAALTKGRMQPACGIGVRGEVRAVALPHAVAAVHETRLVPKDVTEAVRVFSVTFGSGGLRHATLNEAAIGAMAGDASLKAYAMSLVPMLILLQAAFDLAYRDFRRLNKGEAKATEAFQDGVRAASEEISAIAGIARPWTGDTCLLFAKHMAAHNKSAFAAALALSGTREDPARPPYSPSVTGLWLLPDKMAGADS